LATQYKDANSYCNLAECYEYGKGTDIDFDKAIIWYKTCINNGTPQGKRKSQVRIGYILSFEKNEIDNGILYLKAASEDGSAAAYYYLGEIYNHGVGNVPIDYKKALSYFKLSINTDEVLPFVVTLIGDFYYEGKGTPQDKTKAKKMYQTAAKRGDKDAAEKLNMLTF
jgi:TPR repeat protein